MWRLRIEKATITRLIASSRAEMTIAIIASPKSNDVDNHAMLSLMLILILMSRDFLDVSENLCKSRLIAPH